MTAALTVVFVLAYLAIALEEPLKVNKSAAALIAAGLLWTIYALAGGNPAAADHQLNESLIATAQIAFFLMGAMTIVEIVDAHDGFAVITSRLRATSRYHRIGGGDMVSRVLTALFAGDRKKSLGNDSFRPLNMTGLEPRSSTVS